MSSFFGFGPSAKIAITFDGEDDKDRKTVKIPDDTGKSKIELPVFQGHEDISGSVAITSSKALEHIGIKAELIGVIDHLYDKNQKSEFVSKVKELSSPGTLTGSKTYKFEFPKVEKKYESYDGIHVRLKYFVRVTVTRSYSSNIKEERNFWVQNVMPEPKVKNSIKMEVGIEECLHIEFEYNKNRYPLDGVVLGKIYFLLVRIKIKHMELAIIRRETAGSGPSAMTENETLTKYEIMDGAPVRGESIPIRLFLGSFNLTPTFRNVKNKFSVRYYLNLVLVDEEARRYFKQQEITLWRDKE